METSAGIIVYRKHDDKIQYLLLHYEEGHWDFPKGHVEGTETLEETALRETFEETGLKIVMVDGFSEHFTYMFKNKQDLVITKTVHFFLGMSFDSNIRLSDEHIGYVWQSFDHAEKKLTYENAREVLRKADTFLKQRTLGDFN
ncbi:MAG: NUDIX domain-containing protein [Nanoarchaeota archaeon]|nr:NUDIX domain-containing protein [Nanoarchaeota archaeon]